MAIQTGDQVKFFYTADTDALPGAQSREDNTIYFDADARAIYVGSHLVAADNAVNTSGFVTTTSLASTLADYALASSLTNYVNKQTPVVQTSLAIENASTGVETIMTQTANGFSFSTYDEDLSTPYGPAILSNIATPTVSSDAATKAYVDAQVASAGQTWTVG